VPDEAVFRPKSLERVDKRDLFVLSSHSCRVGDVDLPESRQNLLVPEEVGFIYTQGVGRDRGVP
jgi:hypothetical protein